MEEVRPALNENSLDNIDEIFMERSCKIRVIEKKVDVTQLIKLVYVLISFYEF